MDKPLSSSRVRRTGASQVCVVSAVTAALAAPVALPAVAVAADTTVVGTAATADRYGADGPADDDGRGDQLDLDALTIPEAQQRMDDGSLTSVELTEAYLHRIALLDPELNAIIALDDQALDEALASDERREGEGPRSALEGMPVLLKDNIDAEGFATTAGSLALLSTSPDDAELVRRLREPGAIVLGKTNLSEWANFRGLESTSGWSGVGGQTNNPYVLDRNPCSSSSGPGVAAAAALAQVTIGTETDGSIVCPAGQTGVVGLKPTLGLVSRDGIVPISAEQDTAGPIARHVVDVAIATATLQGEDERDAATAEIPDTQPTDYAALLDEESLEGARVGLWRPYVLGRLDGEEPAEGWTPEKEAGLEAVEEVLASSRDALEEAGATVVEVDLPYQDEVGEAEFPLLISEFARDLPPYLEATPGEQPRTVQGLIEFNEADPVELSLFDQGIFEATAEEPETPTQETLDLRAETQRLARASIDEVLAEHDLDSIVAPTNSAAWVTRYTETDGEGDRFLFGSSGPAAVSGYPNVTVPAGYAGPLPIGLSFFGTRWDEAALLSFAYDFEDQTQVRQRPQFLASVDESDVIGMVVPEDGVATGGGDTAGIENSGMLALGVIALGAGALGMVLTRRRGKAQS
jgi:amidase